MRAVIWAMKEAGCPRVPSLETLRRIQKDLNSEIAAPRVKKTTSDENVHYTIDLPAQIGADFANPLVRQHLVFYPEERNNFVKQSWQAKKWLQEISPEHLTPMFIGKAGLHFYVEELTMCRDKTFVVPLRLVTRGGELTADSYKAIVVRELKIDVVQ